MNFTDREKIEIVLSHIRQVENNCIKVAMKLLDTDKIFALELIMRARQHDLSKFDYFEFEHLWSYDLLFKEALIQHRKKNSHHVEFHSNIDKMSELDIAEMVCDCSARAAEFGNSVIEWFKRPEYAAVKERIDYYLSLLLHKPFVYPDLKS